MEKARSNFSSSIGFVLAAAGSAVGLGNIWRFPYLVAKYGGGMFILIYIIVVLTFGFSLMAAEIALGRKTGQSAINAFTKLDKKCGAFGFINAIVPIIITPYYCVIGGWVLKFLWTYITTPAQSVVDNQLFLSYVFNPDKPWGPLFWFALFLGLTIFIVCIGVEKGIEKVSKFLMPLLVILIIGVAIYCCTLPGAGNGIAYYLLPKMDDLKPITVLAAMTQAFFSLSLAMGIMITYGSYMKKNNNVEKSIWQICAFDTGIALLAGLAIIPAIFAFSGSEEAAQGLLKSGPSLMFIVLPQVFANMAMGRFVAIIFFLLVFFAAITSSISLFETVVSIFGEGLKDDRKNSIIMTTFVCIIVGLLSSLGYGPLEKMTVIGMQFLDFFDFISNSVLMPIAAFLTCIFVGWIIGPKTIIGEIESDNNKFTWKKLFVIMIKYVGPIVIVFILAASILQAMGKLSI